MRGKCEYERESNSGSTHGPTPCTCLLLGILVLNLHISLFKATGAAAVQVQIGCSRMPPYAVQCRVHWPIRSKLPTKVNVSVGILKGSPSREISGPATIDFICHNQVVPLGTYNNDERFEYSVSLASILC